MFGMLFSDVEISDEVERTTADAVDMMRLNAEGLTEGVRLYSSITLIRAAGQQAMVISLAVPDSDCEVVARQISSHVQLQTVGGHSDAQTAV